MQRARPPAVAGTFYDFDRESLGKQLDGFFSKTKKGSFPMVISPHAGYAYSGKTAAQAVAGLRESKTYVIIGPNHTGLGHDFSLMKRGNWETPLGSVSIDHAAADEMLKHDFIEDDITAHLEEHSIEVMLPLLQKRFGKFSFVPLAVKNQDYSEAFRKKCIDLGKTLSRLVRTGKVSVIASSDFSHYIPQDYADDKDEQAVEKILGLEMSGFFECLEKNDASVCGFGPIAVVMAAAKILGMKAKLIGKSSSGDVTGDYNSVVTYYAIGFS